MMIPLLVLPLSKEAVAEIAKQVTLRDQLERVTTYDGKQAVVLADVVVVAMPEKMLKDN